MRVKSVGAIDIPFSPLFIGARNVTPSIWMAGIQVLKPFQSPFHRGKECNSYVTEWYSESRRHNTSFSPLFIGARNVTNSNHLNVTSLTKL